MILTIEISEEELHNLANWVQIETWRIEAGQQKRHGMFVMGERILAAANQSPKAVSNGALEYVGKYFQAKASAEHLEVHNTTLMKAVEGMARRAAIMQAALIEAGLADKIPPPVRLLSRTEGVGA